MGTPEVTLTHHWPKRTCVPGDADDRESEAPYRKRGKRSRQTLERGICYAFAAFLTPSVAKELYRTPSSDETKPHFD